MQNWYVPLWRSDFFVGDFQDDFEGHSLFKDNLIARTRRFIDLFVCVNFERVVFAGHGTSDGRMREDTPLLTILTSDVYTILPFSIDSMPSVIHEFRAEVNFLKIFITWKYNSICRIKEIFFYNFLEQYIKSHYNINRD